MLRRSRRVRRSLFFNPLVGLHCVVHRKESSREDERGVYGEEERQKKRQRLGRG